MDALELFPPGVDLGARLPSGDGCANPIGKQGRSRHRGYQAPARPTILNVLVDIRRLLNSDLTILRQGQQQLRQGQIGAASQLSETNDLLQNIIGRIIRLERAVGVVEQPQTPQVRRRRPLDL